jgi:Flp pilus assembly pilin Flp
MIGFRFRAKVCRLEIRRFLADQQASTAIEYALIASGISIAIVSAVWTLGASVRDNLFQRVADALSGQ